ncbi:cold-responsive protein kinase 1-like isoform X2 [Castanea sativa]|uniref:cold-responsive protein kinase 1-like isoform X2 n=1 Tax=Castanea sativa TaxID=21020 RepID=UPI003F653B32
MSFQESKTGCKVNLVTHDQEVTFKRSWFINNQSEISIIMEVKPNPKIPTLIPESISIADVPIYSLLPDSQPFPASLVATTSKESKNPKEVKLAKETSLHDNASSIKSCPINYMPTSPLQLSQEEIKDMTFGRCNFPCDRCRQSRALVKNFTRVSSGLLKAEKTSAISMYHKNILRLIGCHKTENTMILVFPSVERGSLDELICRTGSRGKQLELTFQDKLKIAIGIAEGVRYMHEECPRGPVVHGELVPSNIFLRYDLRPLISGFGQAKWLHLRKPLHITHNSCRLQDCLDQETMKLAKSDVLSFGVLLLRLFFRRSAPHDDRTLIEWAQPLLLERALPELLDEGSEDVDIHGIYRVMYSACICTRTCPDSRPCMSEVIATLKEEKFCDMQSSPISEIVYKKEAEMLAPLAQLSLHS